MIGLRAAFAGIGLVALVAQPSASEIRVAATGLRSAQGDVRVALFRTPETFPESKGIFVERVVPAHGDTVDIVFDGVPPGTYAIAAFHDENGNGRFDKGLLGVPLEGFGFANDASVVLGPPDFTDAAVTVGEAPLEIAMAIRYWFGASN